MHKYLFNAKTALVAVLAFGITSCSDDVVVKQNLRTKIDYSVLTPATPYSTLFVDASSVSTVDLADGNNRHKMFQSINSYNSSNITANTEIDAAKLKNMFTNTGNPFVDITSTNVNVIGADLNAAGVQLKNVVATSKSDAEAAAARTRIEGLFDQIDAASAFSSQTASNGYPGKLGTYLVDSKGIEINQIIQNSLIGALQLDYIGNVLLDEGLTAENYEVVEGKTYTQLEHNWDVAYGLLTLNPIYLAGSTDDKRGTIEFAGGSYIWEYNKANYAKIYPAFLKGRAAIVNNDKTELQAQATFIRTQFEKAVAGAALGYLAKWKAGDATDAIRAHAMGEGLGFVYSLRFATIHGADAAFSDKLLNDLVGSEHGFWDLTAEKINAASDAIKAKFGL